MSDLGVPANTEEHREILRNLASDLAILQGSLAKFESPVGYEPSQVIAAAIIAINTFSGAAMEKERLLREAFQIKIEEAQLLEVEVAELGQKLQAQAAEQREVVAELKKVATSPAPAQETSFKKKPSKGSKTFGAVKRFVLRKDRSTGPDITPTASSPHQPQHHPHHHNPNYPDPQERATPRCS